MNKLRVAMLGAVLTLAGSLLSIAHAQRLQLEGMFTHVQTCGSDCFENPQPRTPIAPLAFSYAVDLAFDDVGSVDEGVQLHRSVSVPTFGAPWTPPRLVPQFAYDRLYTVLGTQIRFDQARYDAYQQRHYWFTDSQWTNRDARGFDLTRFEWGSHTQQRWSNVLGPSGEHWTENVRVSLFRTDTPPLFTAEEAAEPLTFAQLVGLVEDFRVPAPFKRTDVFAHVEFQRGFNDPVAVMLTGSFRLVSFQCRAPQGLDRMAAPVGLGR